MNDCICPNGLGETENPSRDLALNVTFASEIAASIMFRLHRRWFAVFAASSTSGIIGYIPLKMAGISDWLIVGILLCVGILAIWALTSSQMIFSRPASPSYVLAAMRSLQPDRRNELLAMLNTVSLRGQRIPFTQWAVLAAARECASSRAEKEAAKTARNGKAAKMQASLIDAFRGS